MICKHCKNKYQNRSGRGLCRSCWDDPSIKGRYQAIAAFGGPRAGKLAKAPVKVPREFKTLFSKMNDECFLETVLSASVVEKLNTSGVKKTITSMELQEFFGTANLHKGIESWWARIKKLEAKDLPAAQERKLNLCKAVARILQEQVSKYQIIMLDLPITEECTDVE